MWGKMRKFRVLLMASLMIMSLSACSEEKTESIAEKEIITETVPVREKTTEAETEEFEEETDSEYDEEIESETEEESDNGELEVTYTGATKEIGDEKFGYMQVPEDWIRFVELGADESVPLYQFSSPDQVSVVTMSYAENTNAQALANVYYQYMTDNAVDGLTGATVTLDGKTAYQVYGYFTDANKVLVTWTFDGDDGLTHSLSIESQDYDIISLSGTYTLNK